jgi:hypothetical protein
MGNPVFTNEAARDAVITAPSEGQRAYLTAPTVPAATGGSQFLPTGIQTIYNGSAWVCVTNVGAFQSNEGTTLSTSYTVTLTGTPGTNPSVTLSTGTTAIVSISCYTRHADAGGSTFMSVAVSGATTIAASDDYCTGVRDIAASNAGQHGGISFTLSGLTAGTNTFTLHYKKAAGANAAVFGKRSITVAGIA